MRAIGKHLVFTAILVMGGCATKQDAVVQTASTADDPAAANLAPVTDAPQSYTPPRQQVITQPPPPSPPPKAQPVEQDTYDSDAYVEAPEPPPPLPEYTQPECPGENYIWTPGTWNYTSTGYYWVPGVWVMAPFVGALWTPSYWDYEGTRYRWHRGYWGSHIGFYGGVNYGYGYVGRGYEGGYWNRNVFAYNRAVNNVNVTIVHNVYNHNVTVNNFGNRVSYNGGRGGIDARPIPAELAARRERPMPPVAAQVEHIRQAAENRQQFADVNHGRPAVAAVPRPLATSYREPARERPVPAPIQQAPRPQRGPQEPMRQEQARPQQARPEPARQEVRQAQPAARMPQKEVRPAAPIRAEHRQEARPMPPTQQRQEARPMPPVQQRQEARPAPQVRQQEARPVQQPRPESRPAEPQRQASPPRPESRPAQPQRPEERRPEEKRGRGAS
jgi:hypothetical protein